jgi:hypothetical protein
MLWPSAIASLAFGIALAASVGWFFLLLQKVRAQLNSVMPPHQKVSPYPKFPRTFAQIWRNNMINHSLHLLDQHHNYFPTSPLPRKLGISIACMILSFLGIVATAQ